MLAAISLFAGCNAPAPGAGWQDGQPLREEIRIVGSSTLYPFATKVAQEFHYKTGHNVVIEATGSGGGHKLFCDGVGAKYPDITNSSRRQKPSELERCRANGVDRVIEIKVGADGIVFANARSTTPINLTLREVFLALAKEVPVSETDCTLQPNPHEVWSDIGPHLPAHRIEAYGPPPTSGTRDAFVEIAMERGAEAVDCLAELKRTDTIVFKRIAHLLREDGHWIDSGESDNAIVQTLVNTPTAMGVFGYSFLHENRDRIQGGKINGVSPTLEYIASTHYPVSRSLYIYLKAQHFEYIPGMRGFAEEFLSEDAGGPNGYLSDIGLVHLTEEQRKTYRRIVAAQLADNAAN